MTLESKCLLPTTVTTLLQLMATHHCSNLLTPSTVQVSAGVTFSAFKSNPVPWQLKPFPMVSKNPPRTKGLHNPAIPYLCTSSPSVLSLAHSAPAQQLSSCSLNTLYTSGPLHLVFSLPGRFSSQLPTWFHFLIFFWFLFQCHFLSEACLDYPI